MRNYFDDQGHIRAFVEVTEVARRDETPTENSAHWQRAIDGWRLVTNSSHLQGKKRIRATTL
jgi:hypothetical protein